MCVPAQSLQCLHHTQNTIHTPFFVLAHSRDLSLPASVPLLELCPSLCLPSALRHSKTFLDSAPAAHSAWNMLPPRIFKGLFLSCDPEFSLNLTSKEEPSLSTQWKVAPCCTRTLPSHPVWMSPSGAAITLCVSILPASCRPAC